MKRLLTLALAIVPLLSMAQDDMYFTPSKKDKVKKETVRLESHVQNAPRPEVVDYHSSSRSDDDYNRRYSYSGKDQNAGGAYADTTVVGEYDMEDPEIDYRYSRRLIRFHSPRYYAMASPYYWDLMYGYGAWDYLYDPYDPWYWSYGWGYGWSWGPWDCWYGGIWGYHHYNHWAYWGWGPAWGHHHYGWVGGHHVGNAYRPRGEFAQTGRGRGRVGGTAIRTNPAASLSGRGSGVSYRSSANSGSRGMLSSAGAQRSSQRTSQRAGVANPYGTRGSQGLGASRTNADRYNNRSNALNSRVNPSRSSMNAGSSSRQSSASRSQSSTPSRSQSSTPSRSSNTYTPSRSSSSSSSYSSGSTRSGGGGFSGGGGGFSGGGGSRGGGGGGRR